MDELIVQADTFYDNILKRKKRNKVKQEPEFHYLGNKMRKNAAALRSELAIREAMPTGNTFTDRIERVKGDSRIRLNQFDRETDRLRGEGLANNENFDVDAFEEERSAAKDLLLKDQLDAVNKIIAE